MINEQIDLYEYFGVPREKNTRGYLDVYISHIGEIGARIRPSIVVIPGGGYEFCSQREGEPVVLAFVNVGYAAFKLEYSVKKPYPIPLVEAAMAVAYIRENAKKYSLDGHVAAIGFSAGGHLTGMLATMFDDKNIIDVLGKRAKLARPDAVIMSYPVVTTSIYTHGGTAKTISGGDKALAAKLSIENNVTKDSVPAFAWHTYEDDCVPVENSLLLASAYRKAGVPFELHIFEKGWHGLSLITPETCDMTKADLAIAHVGKWFELATAWLKARDFTVKFK